MKKEDRERRVKAARSWDRAWRAEVEALRETDPLFYEISIINEGYGDATPFLVPLEPDAKPLTRAQQRAKAYADFEQEQRERLAVLAEARPDEAAKVAEEWEAWWQGFNNP